jgi:hypothetical protein
MLHETLGPSVFRDTPPPQNKAAAFYLPENMVDILRVVGNGF